MGRYIKVARITKVRKRQGRLVVQSCDGLPFLLEAGMTVHIVPPSLDVPRTVVVSGVWEGADDTVSFEGVADYRMLLEYVGRYCLVARDDIDADVIASAAGAASGFAVQDDRYGDLGRIVDVLDNGFQSTLVVDGAHGEVLVPFVDEFILAVDGEAGRVRTRIPDGLVEDPDAH